MCLHFFHTKTELLEERLVVDLACRLPYYGKHPTFSSLMEIVKRKKDCKCLNVAVKLLADEKSEGGSKSIGGCKNNGYLWVKVKKTSAQFKSNCRDDGVRFRNGRSKPSKGSERPLLPWNRNTFSATPPHG